MLVRIWNRKNNEVLVAMEWTKGRLDHRRYRMIVNQLFMLAAEGCYNDNLIATFDNSPQVITTRTVHDYFDYSTIRCNVFVTGQRVRTMTICE